MTALRKPLEPAPDPHSEASLAASMERLKRRCAEVEDKRAASVIDRKLMDQGALKPGEVIDLGSGEIQQKQVNGGSGALDKAIEPDGAKPSPTPAASLQWLKPNGMAVRTQCGRYSCAKVVTNGRTTYEIWVMVPSGNWFNCIERGLESFAAARVIAQEHADR